MSGLGMLMQAYADKHGLNDFDGSWKTVIPGVRFYRASHGSSRQPLLYQSGIIVMGQGTKRIYLAEESYNYGEGDFLVIGVPMPLECEAITEKGKPILGIVIDIQPTMLHKLVDKMSASAAEENLGWHFQRRTLELGLSAASMSDSLNHAFERILLALQDNTEAKIIGPLIVEEIVYRVLRSQQGHILFELAQHDSHYSRIAKILTYLHKEYASPINVDDLAKRASMSLSGFHRAFRQVTTESPLQYLKKVRLTKAKDLIVLEGKRAVDAASLVGYQSASQFNREFKRHFNATPKAVSVLS